MRLLMMAFRNLGRNGRRSSLAMLSVCISIMMIVVLHGLIGGFMGSIVRNYTKNDVGHINITTTGYRERERFTPVDEYLPDSPSVVDAVASIPGLRGELATVAERIRFGVVLSSGTNSKTALGVAGDPELERGLIMLDRSIAEGRYIEGRGEAIMGSALARDLGLAVGDDLKVVTQRADYGLGFKKFRIVGIFQTHVNAMDNALFQVGLEDARELLAMGAGAQQVLVMLDDYRDADEAAALIESALAERGFQDLSVKPWTAMGDFPRFIVMAESMYVWIYLLVAFLGAFIITNIMMMVVLERKREIGLLKSMGMPDRDVLGLFLIEGTLMGAGGSALGVALGLAFNAVFRRFGFDMTSAMAGFEWPMDNIIYPTVDPLTALGVFAMGTAVAAVVALLPSRSAALMKPIDAIRSA